MRSTPRRTVQPRERDNFQRLLEAGDLYDTYRELHTPTGGLGAALPEAEVYGPSFTWRGAAIKTQPAGRAELYRRKWGFDGKAMRIDHMLASSSLRNRVLSVVIEGARAGPSHRVTLPCDLVVEGSLRAGQIFVHSTACVGADRARGAVPCAPAYR